MELRDLTTCDVLFDNEALYRAAGAAGGQVSRLSRSANVVRSNTAAY